MNETQGSLKSRVATRFLTPIAAAAASAAAGWAAKKAPDFFERTLLPRLRSIADDPGGATRGLPERAASVASTAGDVAQDLTDRAKSLVTSGGDTNGRDRRRFSPEQLEQRRQERSQSRAARRRTGRSS